MSFLPGTKHTSLILGNRPNSTDRILSFVFFGTLLRNKMKFGGQSGAWGFGVAFPWVSADFGAPWAGFSRSGHCCLPPQGWPFPFLLSFLCQQRCHTFQMLYHYLFLHTGFALVYHKMETFVTVGEPSFLNRTKSCPFIFLVIKATVSTTEPNWGNGIQGPLRLVFFNLVIHVVGVAWFGVTAVFWVKLFK